MQEQKIQSSNSLLLRLGAKHIIVRLAMHAHFKDYASTVDMWCNYYISKIYKTINKKI